MAKNTWQEIYATINISDGKIFSFSHLEKSVSNKLHEFALSKEMFDELVLIYEEHIYKTPKEFINERLNAYYYLKNYEYFSDHQMQWLEFINLPKLEHYTKVFSSADLTEPYKNIKSKCHKILELIQSDSTLDKLVELKTIFPLDERTRLTKNWDKIKICWNTNPSTWQEYLFELLLEDWSFLVSVEHIYVDDFIQTVKQDTINYDLVRLTHV